MKDDTHIIKLFENMKHMSKEELLSYMSTAKIANNICNVAGVGSILLALVFTNVFVLSFTAVVLWIFGGMAVGADKTMQFINHLLETKFKDK